MEDNSHISGSVLKLIHQVKDLKSKIKKKNKVFLEDRLSELQKTYKDLSSRAYKETVDISGLMESFHWIGDNLASAKKEIGEKPTRFMEILYD